MDSWFYVLTINKQVSLVTAISSYPLSIRNGTAWQQIKCEQQNMDEWLISANKLFKIFISDNFIHFICVLFEQLQMIVAAEILTMICTSERK